MIEVMIDHSYEDDYFCISTITVNMDDVTEKQRIEKVVAERSLEGNLLDPFDMREQLASMLRIKKELIDIDINEMDV